MSNLGVRRELANRDFETSFGYGVVVGLLFGLMILGLMVLITILNNFTADGAVTFDDIISSITVIVLFFVVGGVFAAGIGLISGFILGGLFQLFKIVHLAGFVMAFLFGIVIYGFGYLRSWGYDLGFDFVGGYILFGFPFVAIGFVSGLVFERACITRSLKLTFKPLTPLGYQHFLVRLERAYDE